MILSAKYKPVVGLKIPLYGLKRALIRTSTQYLEIKIGDSSYVITTAFNVFEFPIIDGKSPNFATIVSKGEDGTQSLYVSIFELGGVPSDDYGKEV